MRAIAAVRYVPLVCLPAARLDGRMQLDAKGLESARQFADLVEAVAERRDIAAFSQLFAHFGPRLRAYFRRLGAADDVAEELMQDVMLALWRRAELFDRNRATVATWLFTIARNRRVDALRRERRPEFDPNDPVLVREVDRSADGAIEADQVARRLHEAFACLPAEQATLVRRSFFDDKSHSVIAQELNLPLGTVKSRLRLALAKLRAAMQDET